MVQTGAPPEQPSAPPPAPAAVVDHVGDPPQLAPDVSLSGEMGEGGFREKQWLVDRAGRFVQLTELLYRILEQVDGRRSLAEIADAASDSTGRGVSERNVRQLLERKLIPLGLVLRADGSLADVPQGQGFGRSLRVNMKMAHVGPNVVDPLTRWLQYLYWPPLLVVLIVAGLVVNWWVLFVHGVGASVRQAIDQPGLLLLALLLIILAAAFHELGHAAALRYGGAPTRGMGAGIYMVYPVFYTDVSENYRLGRWARVRTDLGGFYFNLLFALGVMAVYAATGIQFLVLVVVLIDFDIIRQSLPFVRLDGYWTLADVTGIPDFFSNMGPFLRTVLPIPGWKGRRLPNLKPWVKAVYAGYILLTVPLLVLLLFVMVKSVPRVLATTWVSYSRMGGGFADSLGRGAPLAALSGAVQMLALAIPTFGLLFVVYTLLKSLYAGLWRWGAPSPARRFTSLTGMAGIAAALAYLWAPQLPAFLPAVGGRPGPLYARAAFEPIPANARGTIGDALPHVATISPWSGAPLPAGSAQHAAGGVGATPAAHGSAAAGATPRSGGSPTPAPGAAAKASATPKGSATASASTTPSATPAGTATAAAGSSATPSATRSTSSVPAVTGGTSGGSSQSTTTSSSSSGASGSSQPVPASSGASSGGPPTVTSGATVVVPGPGGGSATVDATTAPTSAPPSTAVAAPAVTAIATATPAPTP